MHEPEAATISGDMVKRKQHTPRRGGRQTDRRHASGGDQLIYGLHAVLAALANPARQTDQLYATRNALKDIEEKELTNRISVEILDSASLEKKLPPGAVHQGLALKTAALPEPALEDACTGAPLIIVLDQVTDPHNVGAILRSSAIFGAQALIMTERHSPPQSGVLAKAASGGLEHVSLVRVTNLTRTLEKLKSLGFTIIGLDGDAPETLASLHLSSPIALVLGAEGRGLRRLTREHCDWLARLPAARPIKSPIQSLNVSNAAAIALYELARTTHT